MENLTTNLLQQWRTLIHQIQLSRELGRDYSDLVESLVALQTRLEDCLQEGPTVRPGRGPGAPVTQIADKG